MHHWHIAFLVILIEASAGQTAAAEQKVAVGRSVSETSCSCPREGRWNVQNLEGWMDCTGPVNLKRTLSEVKDKGTIWILETDCSSVFGEASRKKDEDVLMERSDDCKYQGTINGEEDGFNMVIEVAWTLESDKFIRGEMHSNPSLQGMMCEYYRPFEITFDETIPADEYTMLKKKMEKKLAKVRGND